MFSQSVGKGSELWAKTKMLGTQSPGKYAPRNLTPNVSDLRTVPPVGLTNKYDKRRFTLPS